MKRLLSGIAGAALWAAMAMAAQAAPLFEPGLDWRTLETAHFRIYYTPQFASKARDVAEIAETAHDKLVPYMKVEPPGLTEVILADGYDELNSMAHNSPHRAVWLWMTPPNPDEGMTIGRYDQWLRLLFTHEYTHILQFEETPWYWNQLNTALGGLLLSGVPQLPIEITLNLPDLLTNPPAFVMEGQAVHSETRFTGGGRAIEGDFEMERRMAILEHREPKFDQIVGRYLLDWPVAGYEYTWGNAYIEYLVKHFGEDAPVNVFKAYGAFPYLGYGNATSRVLGVSCDQIFDSMVKEMQAKYGAEQAVWAKQKGAFPTPQEITTSGRYHRHPQWKPDGSLLYGEALKNKGPKLMLSKLDGKPGVAVFNKSTRSAVAYDAPHDRYFFESDTSNSPSELTSYRDLFVFDPKTKKATRLTHEARTFAPAVSPDGKQIVTMLSGDGRTGLGIYDPSGKQLRKWEFDNNDYQFGNPTWSPDGTRIAVATWHNGTRDIWLFDPFTGTQTALWKDEFVDFYPSWSPDSRYLVFCSDRSHGTLNLFAFDLLKGDMYQLSDVLGGAFDPTVSPDGKTIAFANYTGRGYDIATIPFKIEGAQRINTFAPPPLEALPLSLQHPSAPAVPPAPPAPVLHKPVKAKPAKHAAASPTWQLGSLRTFESRIQADLTTPVAVAGTMPEIKAMGPYNPLPTFIPSIWFPVLGQDDWGTNLSIYTFWQDVLLMHTLTLIGGYGFYSERVNYGIRYENDTGRPQWAVSMNEFPDFGRVQLNGKDSTGNPVYGNLWQWDKSVSVSWEYPGLRNPMFNPPPISGDNWSWGLQSEAIQDYSLIPDNDPATPTATPTHIGIATHPPSPFVRDNGLAHSAFVQWQHADTVQYPYDYGPTRGSITSLGLQAGVQVPDATNAADSTIPVTPFQVPFAPTGTTPYARFWADHRFYQEVPWFPKHSIAVRGVAGAVFNQNGEFYDGIWRQPFGYTPLSTVNRWDLTTATDISNRDLLVRGYNLVLGNRVVTLSGEYRLPLLEVERGYKDFPVFIDRIYAVGFVDTGYIWDDVAANTLLTAPDWGNDFKLGAGAELRAQTSLFQAVPVDIRLGIAHGFTSDPEAEAIALNFGLGTTF